MEFLFPPESVYYQPGSDIPCMRLYECNADGTQGREVSDADEEAIVEGAESLAPQIPSNVNSNLHPRPFLETSNQPAA